MKRISTLIAALFTVLPLHAQQTASTPDANQAQLRLVIVDQTGAGIPGATILVTPKVGPPAVTFQSDARGLAISPALTPGDVAVHVEFPGFEPFDGALTLRRGATNQTVTLRISGFKEEVAVTDSSGAEASKTTSSFTLTQEEIGALPDDPDELAEALSQLAGPGGATFFINGFQGGRLPNRDQIRAIRFRQNNYAADNHDAGRTQIEIVTRPNTAWGGNGNVTWGGDGFNARNPQQAVEQPSQDRQVQLSVRGPLVTGRTSFNLNVNDASRYNSNPIIAIDEFGNPVGDAVRSTNDQVSFQAGLEHSLTASQGLYFNLQRTANESLNNGVGGFNVAERASTRLSDSTQTRFRLQGVIGSSKLHEFRVQVNRSANETIALSNAPTINVQDAFTRGGSGVNSDASTTRVEFADNFDFNVGTRHQMRVGLLLDTAWYSSFEARNAAGTWTYRTVDDFLAGRPQQFSQRIGTLDTSFAQYPAGFYWSDEFRAHRDLTLGIGVRNELQLRIDHKVNLMPRLGITWAPFGSQRSAIRGGYGLFYDWYEASLYEQTLRVDGVTVRDIRISCSELNAYCADAALSRDPLVAGVPFTPSGRVQPSPDLKLPQVQQASIGYDRQLTSSLMLQTSYQMLRGRHTMRSRNINAPVNGVRPDPEFGDITQFESTGRTQSDRLTLGTQFRRLAGDQPMMLRFSYTLGQEKNYADGATSLPSDSLHPDVDWGPSRQDIRHRIQVQGQLPIAFGIRTGINLNVNSGAPYNMTTGFDDNNDGTFNDRPDGVTRNALRGDWTWALNLNVSKRIGLGGLRNVAIPGQRAGNGALFAQGGGGQGGPGGGFGGPGGPGGRPPNDSSRFSLEIFAQAQNVLNRVTRTGYTGNLSSPFFGQPTSVGQARDVNVGLRFNF